MAKAMDEADVLRHAVKDIKAKAHNVAFSPGNYFDAARSLDDLKHAVREIKRRAEDLSDDDARHVVVHENVYLPEQVHENLYVPAGGSVKSVSPDGSVQEFHGAAAELPRVGSSAWVIFYVWSNSELGRIFYI